MLYCFDKDLNFDYSEVEMSICKENKNGILYDAYDKIFTDFNGKKVDISGKTIFPRTGAAQIKSMIEEIINQGGIPNLTNEETDKIEMWPNFYKTKRKIKVLKGRDLQNQKVIKELEEQFGNEIFIKTVKKGFNSVIPISLLKDRDCVFYKALSYHADEDFIVSEKITLTTDKYGKKEYRCFVINNEPYNISRFTTEVFHEIDEEVLVALHRVIEQSKGRLPSTYEVDLLEYEQDGKKHIDVSEFNPPQAAGLYLYNSILEPSSDILHRKDIKKISREFLPKKDECTLEGEVINGRNSLYEIPRSFANDLRSIYLMGSPGITFVADIPFNSNCFAYHGSILSFEPITDLSIHPMSDEDLTKGPDEEAKVYIKEDNKKS